MKYEQLKTNNKYGHAYCGVVARRAQPCLYCATYLNLVLKM